MTQAQQGNGVLHLRGRPRDVIGAFRAPPGAPRTVTVCCDGLPGTEGRVDLRARVARELADGLSTLRLTLPPTTPPGSYECTVQLGEDEEDLPVVIEVEPYPRTRLLSDDGDVAGAPGSEHTLTTTVMNLGNVALDVTPSVSVRLTDGDMIDAVLSAVSAESDSDARLRAFADGLAGADGDTVELAISEGTGKLDPGATRELSVSFQMPPGLKPGRTYAGNWAIGEARYTLRLHPEAEPVPKGGGQRSAKATPKGGKPKSAPQSPGTEPK